eukprot:6175927-Pleurochrysis_carterae.AAC.6
MARGMLTRSGDGMTHSGHGIWCESMLCTAPRPVPERRKDTNSCGLRIPVSKTLYLGTLAYEVAFYALPLPLTVDCARGEDEDIAGLQLKLLEVHRAGRHHRVHIWHLRQRRA